VAETGRIAIAAEILRNAYRRVAILDFDTYHVDGAQGIFDRRIRPSGRSSFDIAENGNGTRPNASG
jgi:acetoin utilization deacetylase AcuC-like enzyme